jgi:hypothetical protein
MREDRAPADPKTAKIWREDIVLSDFSNRRGRAHEKEGAVERILAGVKGEKP